MEPQEGDIADLPDGRTAVRRNGRWVVQGSEQSQPQTGYQVQPMDTPALQRQREQDAYQRERDARTAANEAERLRLQQEAASREATRFANEQARQQNTGGIQPAAADARTRLTMNLGSLVQAQRTLQDMEAQGYSYNKDLIARGLEAVPLDGGYFARWAGQADYQRYDQAARSFEAAVMPIMSGSAVTPSEAQRQIRASLPQAGDSPEVLAAKARNRSMMINAAAAMVGQPQPFPEVGVWGQPDQQGQQDQSVAQAPGAAPASTAAPPPAANGGPAPVQPPNAGLPNLDGMSRDEIIALNLKAGDYVLINGDVHQLESAPHPGAARDRVNADPRGVIYRQLDPAALDEARRRMQQMPEGGMSLNQGMMFNMADELGGVAAGLGTRADNAIRSVTGQDPLPYTGQQMDEAMRFAQRENDNQFRQAHPIMDAGLRTAGALLSPGSRSTGEFIAGREAAAGANIGQRLMTSPKLVPQSARAAAVGAGYGAAYGYGDAQGSPQERLPSMVEGAQTGAVTGAAAPGAGRMIGVAVDKVVAPAIRGGVRMINRATGGSILNPQTEARNRLVEAMRADRLDSQTIQRAIAEWEANGGPSPTFLDIVSTNGGGQNTRALVRGAAMGGPARNVASQHANRVEADIQGNAINRTRQLTPDQRTVQQAQADLEASRSAQAQADYAGPYQARVPVTSDVQSALSDAPGRNAIARARAAAEARRDAAQVAELDALLSDNPPAEVSAGTLDRIRIALSGRGERLAQNPATRDISGGLFDRAAGVDNALQGVDAIAPARANYRDASQQIEGLSMGAQVRTAAPDQLAADIAARPGASVTAPLGAARKLETDIGRPAEGSTGALNTIGSSTNVRRNLETIFGKAEAARYQGAIQQIVEQVHNARFINPNTGSQTAGRAADEALVSGSPTAPGFWIGLWRKLSTGQTTLTDAEREAIVKLATGEAGAAPQPQVRRPITPRMVGGVSGYTASRRDDPNVRMTR